MFKHGIKYKTDKLTHHGYERFYDFYLNYYKHKKINLFEIGIDAGRSLKMWNDMFKQGKIYGMDIDHEYEHEKGKIYKGDQSNKKDLDKIIKEIKIVDIIIDDGSHKPEHQLFTFNYLFKNFLNMDGLYIIEDIETSYWKNSKLYDYKIDVGYDDKNNIVKIFRDIADIVNREFLIEENIKIIKKYNNIDYDNLKYISSITFGSNCIIIKKMSKEEYKKYANRVYRFKKNL
jgi:23S rRNA U2552 (ribose-2'-O)-methylase RlmE/FtsJ